MLDALQRSLDGILVRCGDFDHAFAIDVLDADVRLGVGLNLLDDLSTWADDGSDAVARNLQGDNAWGMVLVIVAWLRELRQHGFADVVAAFTGLLQSFTQLIKADALDLDVHLASSDA